MRRHVPTPGALVLGLLLLWGILAWGSLGLGGVTWDEMFDFEGVNGAFWHGINWLKGAHPDRSTITFDLEYFGNATRWPTYLLWRQLMILPWERIASLERTEVLMVSNYFGLNHLNAIVFALLGLGLTTALAWQLGGRRAGLLAGALLLALPTWMGHGWMNSKDIPMASSYLLYTLGTTLLLRQKRGGAVGRLAGIALMAGSRVSSVVFIALGEALLLAWQGRRAPKPWLGSLVGGLLLGFLLTPQAWDDPLGYPLEAMRFISERQGSGDSLAALSYLVTNLWDLLPSPMLIGLALLALPAGSSGGGDPDEGQPREQRLPRLTLALPTLLQLLIPPTLLVLGGKTLYNELRHLLMIQPPIAVLAGLGYTKGWAALKAGCGAGWAGRLRRGLIRALLFLGGGTAILLTVELLLLHPYQYTYRSDLARLWSDRTVQPVGVRPNPSLRNDYWGFSGRETLSRCLKQPACEAALAQAPLKVDGHTFNPDLITANANLLRPPPLSQGGKKGSALSAGSPLITTDPITLDRLETLASTQRFILLPRPQRATLSAIVRDPNQAKGP